MPQDMHFIEFHDVQSPETLWVKRVRVEFNIPSHLINLGPLGFPNQDSIQTPVRACNEINRLLSLEK